jgi:two-component system sensor histidine kinase SenX3
VSADGVALALGTSLVIVVVVALWAAIARRRLARRLDVVSTRLALPDALPSDSGGLEATIGRLERAAGAAVADLHAAEANYERLGRALEHLTEGVLVCDQSGEVLLRNQAAADFVGNRHGEALASEAGGRLVGTALAGSDATETIELFGPPRRTLVITTAPIHGERRPLGAIAVIEDASERRRLDAVRRDFVANISHELKTPIGALGVLAETLRAEDDPAVVNRLAARMQAEAIRVGRIIDDLLDLSRIESQEHPEREPVGMQLLVGQALERVRGVADSQGISIEAGDISRRLKVVGDRRQLVSALHNLLENAVKYSDDGGVVRVSVRHTGTWIEVDVTDQGIGIPSRDLERIFERFYRVDRGRGRDTGGTGLGLAIVRHVAGNHRGEIVVASREGEGSTFTLRLPAGPTPAVVTAEAG